MARVATIFFFVAVAGSNGIKLDTLRPKIHHYRIPFAKADPVPILAEEQMSGKVRVVDGSTTAGGHMTVTEYCHALATRNRQQHSRFGAWLLG